MTMSLPASAPESSEPHLSPPAASAPAAASARLDSVDLLRGLVMVLMALDHVRDFFTNARFEPTDFSHTTAALFLTRWVTHFCAPVFFFTAGVAAFLSFSRGKPRGALARFLVTRGLWLVVLELTVIRFGWVFNLDYRLVGGAVIWALGWSMVALAGLIYLPRPLIAFVALGMIAGHNLLDGITLQTTQPTLNGAGWQDWAWAVLHVQRPPIIYPLIPWIGVMAAGYLCGPLLLDAAWRRRWLPWLGVGLIAAFIVLRATNLYGEPSPWVAKQSPLFTALAFLDTEKYPPSLLYLLMTLGPALAGFALFERASGPIARFFITFGRVPLFYYIAHLYLIHALAVLAGVLSGYEAGQFLTMFHGLPRDYGFSLPVVYAVWTLVVLMLYPVCRWFAGLKARRKDAWLSYL
jgi:uncharacterized membrane protein